MILTYTKNQSTLTSNIIYAYEFNTEYMQSKNEKQNNLICFVVQEAGESDLIEYYLNRNTNPDEIWWHNRFLKGTYFEKKTPAYTQGRELHVSK